MTPGLRTGERRDTLTPGVQPDSGSSIPRRSALSVQSRSAAAGSCAASDGGCVRWLAKYRPEISAVRGETPTNRSSAAPSATVVTPGTTRSPWTSRASGPGRNRLNPLPGIAPGWTLLDVTDLSSSRRASSAANRMLASLEWLYAASPVDGSSPVTCARSSVAPECAADAVVTTRDPSARWSSNSAVSRYGDRWLTWNVYSTPMSVSAPFRNRPPALFTSRSSSPVSARTVAARSCTASTLVKSAATNVPSAPTRASSSTTVSPACLFLPCTTTSAPSRPSASAVSRPIPLVDPVTSADSPVQSTSATPAISSGRSLIPNRGAGGSKPRSLDTVRPVVHRRQRVPSTERLRNSVTSIRVSV